MLIFQVSKQVHSASSFSGKAKTISASAQEGNLFLESQKSDTPLVPFRAFTSQMLQTYNAAKKSAAKLEKAIYGRTIYMLENMEEHKDGRQYFGPNLDDCYFHRQWVGGVQSRQEYDYDLATLAEQARDNAGVFLLAWHLDYMRKWAPTIAARASSSSPDIVRAFSSRGAMRSFASELELKNRKVIVSNDEMQLEFMANGNARLEAGSEKTANFILKHYPPAPATDATHRSTMVFPGLTLSQLSSHYSRSFDYFLSENKATSVMLSHSAFPGIEEELAKKHQEIKSIIPAGIPTPACLSPHIIRGHLRKEIGYKGMVIPDDFDMIGFITMLKSIFQQAKSNLPQGASFADAVTIFAIYAGLNEFPLKSSDRLEYGDPNPEVILRCYGSNKEFKKLVDDMLREKLFFQAKFFSQKEQSYESHGEKTIYHTPQFSPNPAMLGMQLSDLYADPNSLPAEKARIIGEIDRLISEMDFGGKIKTLKMPFSKGTDLRNRGNNFSLQLRKGIIEELYELKLPDYPLSTDERVPIDLLLGDALERKKPSSDEISRMERDWQESLFANKEFSKAYYSINWNSVEMRSIFAVLEKEAQNPMLRKAVEEMKK